MDKFKLTTCTFAEIKNPPLAIILAPERHTLVDYNDKKQFFLSLRKFSFLNP